MQVVCGLYIDYSTLLIGDRRFALITSLLFISSPTSQVSSPNKVLIYAIRCIIVHKYIFYAATVVEPTRQHQTIPSLVLHYCSVSNNLPLPFSLYPRCPNLSCLRLSGDEMPKRLLITPLIIMSKASPHSTESPAKPRVYNHWP